MLSGINRCQVEIKHMTKIAKTKVCNIIYFYKILVFLTVKNNRILYSYMQNDTWQESDNDKLKMYTKISEGVTNIYS